MSEPNTRYIFNAITPNMAYLQRWAVALKVSDLLERALVDAGLSESK